MAARNSPHHTAESRNRIRTTQLVNRVQAFALGGADPQTGLPVEMTRDRLTAALALLRKTLPDLTATTLTADPGTTAFVIFGEREAESTEAWTKDYPPPG